MNGFITVCGVLLTFLIIADGESHFCPETYTVLVTRQAATTYECGEWKRRCTRYRREYDMEFEIDENVCCENFTGENCDIPLCNPPCQGGAPCIVQGEQNICYCREGYQGTACDLESCSASNNCYPGACVDPDLVDEDLTCACTPGFEGPTCGNLLTAAVLESCEMLLINYDGTTDIILASFDCTTDSLDTIYTSGNDADYMELNYELLFDRPATPTFPTYVRSLNVGLIASSLDKKIVPAGALSDNEITTDNIPCVMKLGDGDDPPSQTNPREKFTCNIRTTLDKAKVQHKGQLSVVINGESGGYKEYIAEGNTYVTNYNGSVSNFERSITFDLESPTHCSDTVEKCAVPVTSDSDITTNPKVRILWLGWTDDYSGIGSYSYSINKMAKGTTGNLTEKDKTKPIFTKTTGPETYFFDYTFETAGMYSIRLEIVDRAGNSNETRCLVLFDSSSDITIDESHKITVDYSDVVGDPVWFTDTSEDLVISWKERYRNMVLHSNNWLDPVEPDSDIRLDYTYGNRTISGIENKLGIKLFSVTYDTGSFDDLKDSPVGIQEKSSGLEEIYVLTERQDDGKAVRFFITAVDALGNEKIEMQTVHFDSTPAEFVIDESVTEFSAISEDLDVPFTTRVDLRVHDRHSGIQYIEYDIYDISGDSNNEPIYTGSQEGHQVQPKDCEEGCYCSYSEKNGPCFTYTQTIWLDHCKLKEQINHTLELRMTVTNGASLTADYNYNIGKFVNPSGLTKYHEPTDIEIQGDVPKAIITWHIKSSCYIVESILVKIREDGDLKEKALDKDERRYDLRTIENTPYVITVIAIYAGGYKGTSESITFGKLPTTLSQSRTATEAATGDEPADLFGSLGFWIAVGVGGLIFLALISLIIVMIVRKTQQKPVVPPVLREKAVRLRDGVSSRISRISQYFGRQSQAEDDDEEKGGAERRDKSRRRRSLGFRWSRYNVHDDEVRLDGKKKDENRRREKDRERDRPEQNGEDSETLKPPKSILKPVQEDTEKSEEKPTKAADSPGDSGPSHALSAEVKRYGKEIVPKDAPWIIQDSAYSLGNAVSNTHSCFSEMRMATLRDLGSTNVVAKTNRPGASYEDKMQMTALMNFLATGMPKHENIVAFYGAVPPTAKTAPILFLEYCDEGSLLYWVKETRNVTDEIEDQMINFAIHIATGMDHMHLNGMLHRKLRAENILLKHSFANQMVAKISGMGPENDTVKKDDEGEDSTQRWVAPEQYEKARLFTHKTDIWSYGVLLHEMFNMGKEPYCGMSVTEMKESVKSGFRMGKPRHAPEFLYDGVMKQCWQENQGDRPDFSELTNVMTAYFEGGKGEPDLDPKLIELMDS